MITIVEFSVPGDVFPLGYALSSLPDAAVELERVVPTGGHVVPYFWVHGATAADLAGVVDDHEGVIASRIVDEVDDSVLVRTEWDPDQEGILKGLAEHRVTLLEATGADNGWRFRVRGDDREDVAAFQRYCRGLDLPVAVVTVYSPVEAEQDPDLTSAQREALLAALEAGYYDTPRTGTLADVGETLGISRQAVAERLRRGHRKLVSRLVTDGTGNGLADDST